MLKPSDQVLAKLRQLRNTEIRDWLHKSRMDTLEHLGEAPDPDDRLRLQGEQRVLKEIIKEIDDSADNLDKREALNSRKESQHRRVV